MKSIKKVATIVGSAALAMFLASGSWAQSSRDDVSGTVVSVSPAMSSFQVKLDDDGTTESFLLASDANVRIRGRSAGLEDLMPGDRVELDFEEMADQTRSTRRITQGENPRDRRAEVLDVDTSDNEMTVRFIENDQEETYYIAPDTDIWVNGRLSDLGDVNEGDRVILDFEERESNRPVVRWLTYEAPVVPVASGTQVASNNTNTSTAPRVARLPSTASPIPLIGLAGLLLLGFASLMRIHRSKSVAG